MNELVPQYRPPGIPSVMLPAATGHPTHAPDAAELARATAELIAIGLIGDHVKTGPG